MNGFALLVTFVIRLMIVLLFMPLSALDKVLNYRGAVKQAREAAPSNVATVTLIVLGFLVEVLASVCIVTGSATDPRRSSSLAIAASRPSFGSNFGSRAISGRPARGMRVAFSGHSGRISPLRAGCCCSLLARQRLRWAPFLRTHLNRAGPTTLAARTMRRGEIR
jgi:hypothetical protein